MPAAAAHKNMQDHLFSAGFLYFVNMLWKFPFVSASSSDAAQSSGSYGVKKYFHAFFYILPEKTIFDDILLEDKPRLLGFTIQRNVI